MPHSGLVLQGYQFLFKLRGKLLLSFPLLQKQCRWYTQSQTTHTNEFFHMPKLSLKELLGLLEIESFITCLGKVCSVLYSTVLPMFARTLEVMNEKHQCTFLFNSVRSEKATFKADL